MEGAFWKGPTANGVRAFAGKPTSLQASESFIPKIFKVRSVVLRSTTTSREADLTSRFVF